MNRSDYSDYLFIDGLEEACRVGTSAEERSLPQIILVSIKMYLDLRPAGASDDLTDSVDYANVCQMVRSTLSAREFTLIETVAETVANIAFDFPLVEAVSVRAEKRILSATAGVGAQVFRQRKA